MAGLDQHFASDLTLFQNRGQAGAVEKVQVPGALLFTGRLRKIRSSPTIHPNSPTVH
jgi:hypothetical protein